MYDVIRAQFSAAQASLVAGIALLDHLFAETTPQPASEDSGEAGVCRHDLKLPIPGRPDAWVCQHCSYNHPPEEGA